MDPKRRRGDEPATSPAYWNHNAAYHRWIERHARPHSGSLLDVGCGEGLLLQRLSSVCATVVGVEIDESSVRRARIRLTGTPHATVVQGDFTECDFTDDSDGGPGRLFDVITFVASLHHLPLEATLVRAKDLLAPSGVLLVVGLAARATALDWVLSGLAIPVVRTANILHHEVRNPDVPVAPPRESLGEIRSAARAILPGVRIRRGLYYRYLLQWTKPAAC